MLNHVLISRNPDLLETTLDNEIVLMSIERGNYFGLEATAKHIWQLLELPQTKEILLEKLSNEYEAEREVIDRDLDDFLKKLLDNGVVITQ